MNYLPSKELLSEVLGHKIWKVMDCNMGTLRYCIYPNKEDEPSEYIFPINIYELAHMCKEWALSEGYYFSIYSFNFSCNTEQEHRIRLLLGNEVVYWGNDSCNETEPEAIFQACQWILDNKN